MSIIEISQLLYDSEFGTALRESVYVFPIVEGVHLISLAFSVGLILFVDLRLTGLFLSNVPVSEILKPLRPWLLSGFLVTIATGIALFIAEASKVIVISVFPLKILFIFLAGINAAWFEHKWGRNAADWGNLTALPQGVKLAGLASIALWSGVVITGRLIPYFGYH